MKGVPFLSKSGIEKGKGLNLPVEPHWIKFCCMSHPPVDDTPMVS